MALSDVINQTSAPAAAPVAPATAPATAPAAKAKGNDKHSKFLAEGSKLMETNRNEAVEGSKAGSIAFIRCLGDPTRPSKRTEGGNSNIPTYLVIGYEFKALEDVYVPVAPYREGAKTFNDVDAKSEDRLVKAGETFSLNLMETGMLISRPEYCGTFNGDGTTVKFEVKYSMNSDFPRPLLQKAGVGSIKENIGLVADVEKKDNKNIFKAIKPGYEAFEPYFHKRTAVRGTGATAPKADNSKALAYAFQAYIQENIKKN